MTANIPIIHLVLHETRYKIAFTNALTKYWPQYAAKQGKPIIIHLHQTAFQTLDHAVRFNAIVSPANSYGRLDGSFDYLISAAFTRPHNRDALTRASQKVLYERYRGFAPPGTATLVPFPEDMRGNERACRWVLLCPTMRLPGIVKWDREVVYECVWSMLCEVEAYNRKLATTNEAGSRPKTDKRIDSILMTPLATGVGAVPVDRWAAQAVLAMKHFVDALERPGRWRHMGWSEINKDCAEIAATWKKHEE